TPLLHDALPILIMYWAMTPIKTVRGALTTRLKSSKDNDRPIPNIIIPSSKETYGDIQANPLGRKKARTENKITQIANVLPANVLILSNFFIQFISFNICIVV